jgi:hypothetical protein
MTLALWERTTLALFYRGHSLGLAGTIAVIASVAVRLAFMYARRRSRNDRG